MASIGQTGQILGINPAPPSSSGVFTLTLYDTPPAACEKSIMQYTFYITPQDIQINKPGRLSVYQSIGGAAHVDHIGEGLVSITISGMSGFNPLIGPAGFVQYSLLRNLIDLYYERCRSGMAAQSRLELNISFPDYPNYGRWDVTVKDMALSRSAQAPLLNKYNLSFIAVSADKASSARNALAKSNENRVRPVGEFSLYEEARKALDNIGKSLPYSIVVYTIKEANQSLNDVIKLFYSETLSDEQAAQVRAMSGLEGENDLAVGTVLHLPWFK